jgi:DNA polymerase III sliding clamp (beta) subunit (PCNA family)
MIHLAKNQVRFAGEFGTATFRLSEGRFPQWRDIVPSSGGSSVSFDADDFVGMLENARQFIDEEHKSIELMIKQKKLSLVGEFPRGKLDMSIECSESSGAFAGWFDPNLLLDYAKRENGQITLTFWKWKPKKIIELCGVGRYFLSAFSDANDKGQKIISGPPSSWQ